MKKQNLFQERLSPLFNLIKNNLNISYEGLENIKKKNYIFVMNHQSILDIPITYSFLTPILNHQLVLFISHKFYDFLWPIMAPLGAIRVEMYGQTEKTKKYNNNQLEEGVKKLNKGCSVLIYPEGIIRGGINSEIIKGKTGVIKLAIKSKIPIIPIGIKGSNLVYPFLLKSRNPFLINKDLPIKICIGREISFSQYDHQSLDMYSEKNKEILHKLTNDLMKILSQLSGLSYNPNA